MYLPQPERIYIPLLSDATDLNDCAKSVLEDYQSGRFDLDKFYTAYQVAMFFPHDLKGLALRDPRAENIAAARAQDSDLLVDATPYLQSFAREGEQLAWTSDPHPNALGHKRIAEFVATLIKD